MSKSNQRAKTSSKYKEPEVKSLRVFINGCSVTLRFALESDTGLLTEIKRMIIRGQ